MTIEAVNQFLQKVSEDAQLQEELAKAMQSDNDRQAVVELAIKQGYQFTAQELWQEIENRKNAAVDAGELNEEELEAVAGGATPGLVVTPATPKILIGGGAITAAVITKAKW